MPSYTITEPHPTVAKNTYVHAGRGGAGNHFRAPQTTSPSGVPTALAPVGTNATSTTAGCVSVGGARRFYSGRGGAGNAHSHAERPVLSFEDEFSRADKRERSAALGSGYHVGRGGAGNFTAAPGAGGVFTVGGGGLGSGSGSGPGKKGRSGSGSSVASSSSSGSVGSAIMRRLSGVLRH